MSKRLAEVAAELLVSTKDITDFLTEKGVEVGSSRNAKINEETYQLLVKNFKKSLDVKEKAEKLNIGVTTRPVKKEEPKPKEKARPWEKPTLGDKEPKSLKGLSVSSETTKTTEPVLSADLKTPQIKEENTAKESEVIRAQTPGLQGLKIQGKIDLDANRKRNNPPQSPKNQPQQPKVQVKETPKEQPVVKAEQTPPVKVEVKPVSEKPVEVKPPVVKEVDSPVESKDETLERIEAPTLRGLKILGKINIEASPSAKKKKKKRDRRPETTAGPNQGVQTNRNQGQGQGQQGQGQGQQGQGNRQNNGNNQNRGGKQQDQGYTNERRRQEDLKNQQAGGTNNTAGSGSAPGSTDDKKKKRPMTQAMIAEEAEKRKKKGMPVKGAVLAPKAALNEDDTVKRGGTAKKKKKGGKEVSTREVQDNIKATMAKVQGQGKKKRGSTRSARDERKERLRQQDEHIEEEALQVTEFISVSELASLMDVSATDIIMACMKLGVIVSINQRLDAEIIELVANEFGFEVEFISAEDQMEMEEEEEEDAEESLQMRAPIVTVMGHVDHGKTSLLDYIRKANVVAGEAGGITQHIGAYEVSVPHMDNKRVTFLDTPGHEAFTAMRARGAKVTDIAVIIIAADDSIMPQTREAISHAQAANVPMVFAINKIDKPGASPDKIRQELAGMNLLVEEWGGKYQSQEISAKHGLNVDLLLEKIVLEAELLDLKANPDRQAVGTILEASLEKGRGYVAKVLIQNGTLNIGDVIVSGSHAGKVKAMFNERGKRVKEAGPSSPVLVLGLDGVPQAGEKIKVMTSEREARELANRRAQIVRQQQIRATRRITLDEIGRRLALGNFKKLNLIIKGDMDGSVEALSDSLLKLSTEAIQTEIVYKAVGPITESDVLLASASDAIIIGFQVRPNPMAKKLAEQEGVQIKLYSVIYSAIEEVKSALEGMLEPKKVEQELGQVLIQEVYKITKVGTVAGCIVQEGKIHRNNFIRVVRNGIVVFPTKEGSNGELASLKRFKDNVMEVKNGFECGLTIKNFSDIREGDIIEAYEIVEVKQTL